MKRTLILITVTIALAGCDRPATTPENKLNRPDGDLAINMHYTQKTTTFDVYGKTKNAEASPEINRTVPIISKEKIEFKIFKDGGTEMFMENLPGAESFFSTDAKPAKDAQQKPHFYQLKNGNYSVYDANRNLIFEQASPELNFNSIVENIRKRKTGASSVPPY